MANITVRLFDGQSKEVPEKTPASQIFEHPEDIIAVKIDGKLCDAYIPLVQACMVEPVTLASEEAVELLRHSCAHLLAHAVLHLYGDVEFAIGPTIEDGFYYDFDLDHTFTPEDLSGIEKEMARIASEKIPIRRMDTTKEGAREIMEKQRARFKLELLDEEIGRASCRERV